MDDALADALRARTRTVHIRLIAMPLVGPLVGYSVGWAIVGGWIVLEVLGSQLYPDIRYRRATDYLDLYLPA